MQTIGAAKARATFATLLRRVSEDGERILIDRRGKPRVAMVPVEDLKRIEEELGQARDALEQRVA